MNVLIYFDVLVFIVFYVVFCVSTWITDEVNYFSKFYDTYIFKSKFRDTKTLI